MKLITIPLNKMFTIVRNQMFASNLWWNLSSEVLACTCTMSKKMHVHYLVTGCTCHFPQTRNVLFCSATPSAAFSNSLHLSSAVVERQKWWCGGGVGNSKYAYAATDPWQLYHLVLVGADPCSPRRYHPEAASCPPPPTPLATSTK